MPSITLPTRSNGLLIEVKVWISAPRRAILFRGLQDIPPPIPATFMIDTGADSTMVNDQLMRSLRLPATSQTRVLSSTSNGLAQTCDVHDIELQLLNKSGDTWYTIGALEVVARPLMNHSIEGMIGRDVLDRGALNYDGRAGRFTLDF